MLSTNHHTFPPTESSFCNGFFLNPKKIPVTSQIEHFPTFLLRAPPKKNRTIMSDDDEYNAMMTAVEAEMQARKIKESNESKNESKEIKAAKEARKARRRACGATKPLTEADKYHVLGIYGTESADEAALCLCCVGRGIKRKYDYPRGNSGTHGSKVTNVTGNPDERLHGPRPCDSERGEFFRQWIFNTVYTDENGLPDPNGAQDVPGKFGWPHPNNPKRRWGDPSTAVLDDP